MLFHVSLFLTVGLTSTTNVLRVCNTDGQAFEVNDRQCARGAWVPDGVAVGCVCATGIWVLSEKYCDESFYVVAGGNDGETSCFSVNNNIRRFISLTDSTSTRYKQYLIQSNGDSITEVTTDNFSPQQRTPVVILRVNPKSDMYVIHKEGVHTNVWQKCIPKPPGTTPSIQVIKTEDSVSYFKSIRSSRQGEIYSETCDDIKDTEFPYVRSNGTVYAFQYGGGGGGWGVATGKLSSECSCDGQVTTATRSRVRQATGKKSRNDVIRNTDKDYDTSPNDITDLFSKDPLIVEEHLKDNSRTTASMLSHLKNYLLQGTTPPSVSTPTFQYIRFGRNVMLKMCPQINAAFIRNLVGLFGILVTEVLSRFPEEYPNNLDVETHSRVVDNMKKCVDTVNRVGFISGVRKRGCTERVRSVSLNGSVSLPVANVPSSVRFNRQSDVVIEVAWKAMLVAHYACSEFFEAHPDDLSFMYVKSQEFLTIPYVLFRWENAASYLTDAYKTLNPGLDVNILSDQIDACVFAAYTKSPYKTWLSRPESDSEYIREKIIDSSMAKLTNENGNRHHNHRTLFDKTGYCVQQFNEPVRWTHIDESVAAKC